MRAPFPGMDPYLEDPEVWRGFHHHVAEEAMRELNPLLPPRYYAEVEVLVGADEVEIAASGGAGSFIADAAVPDPGDKAVRAAPSAAVAIPEAPVRRPVVLRPHEKLRSVRIHKVGTSDLVTTIEILSPWNKRPGEGLEVYRRKRDRLLRSPVHLVEIDLLRTGERPGPEVRDPPLDCEYVVLVNRSGGDDVRTSEIWPIRIQDRLPVLPVPLVPPDADVPLDLANVLEVVYRVAGYGRRIDYGRPVPPPPLSPESARWIDEHRSAPPRPS